MSLFDELAAKNGIDKKMQISALMRQSADIDYIAMMCGIELDSDEDSIEGDVNE